VRSELPHPDLQTLRIERSICHEVSARPFGDGVATDRPIDSDGGDFHHSHRVKAGRT